MADPCTPLEERAAIIAEACGVSQEEAMRRATAQLSTPPIDDRAAKRNQTESDWW